MSTAQVTPLASLMSRLPSQRKLFADYQRSGCHASCFLDADQLLPAVQILFDEGFFLEDLAGLDTQEGIMLVYHFDRHEACQRVALRLTVPHAHPRAPSIASIFSGADWHERECYDFFGVTFDNHPNLKPLLLPDDLGIHPLLKEKQRRSLYNLLPLTDLVDSPP
jgi:NADH-quinone oxidoreductase subunit C